MRPFVVLGLCAAGCVTAPGIAPPTPMGDAVVQAGAAPLLEGGAGVTTAAVAGAPPSTVEFGGGAAGFVGVQPLPDLTIVASGHGAYLHGFTGGGSAPSRVVASGRGGVRYLRPLLGDRLYVGGEVGAGYLGSYPFAGGPTQHFVMAHAGLPVAEATPWSGVWVYSQPTVGIAVPLHGAEIPFAGFFEVPLGISIELTPNLLLFGEVGLASPVQGPYGAFGMAVRL